MKRVSLSQSIEDTLNQSAMGIPNYYLRGIIICRKPNASLRVDKMQG